MSRESFLARVRQSAAAGRAYRVATRALPEGTGYQGAGDDPAARFLAEVEAVGGRGYRARSREAVMSLVAEIIGGCPVRSALTWDDEALGRLSLAEFLQQRGIEHHRHSSLALLSPEVARQLALAADVGISGATWAIAETGSVVVASGPGTERIVSLLPPVYISIVEQSRLLPDLFDLFAKLEPSAGGDLPSNLALITGPSKTGDIELQLTTGVHGPGVWHVILWQ